MNTSQQVDWKAKARELEKKVRQLKRIIGELTAADKEPLPFTGEAER